jgi:hypothetical protein
MNGRWGGRASPHVGDGGPGSGIEGHTTNEPDFSPLTEAKRKWQAAEFNYAKNPINTFKVRLDNARAAYAKEKSRSGGA